MNLSNKSCYSQQKFYQLEGEEDGLPVVYEFISLWQFVEAIHGKLIPMPTPKDEDIVTGIISMTKDALLIRRRATVDTTGNAGSPSTFSRYYEYDGQI